MTATADRLQVVLVDDHQLFREGLREMLADDGIAVAGEGGDARAAVQLGMALRPDVAIIDLRLRGESGIDAIKELARTAPGVALIVLTASADPADARDALAAGARGYLLKDTPADELVRAIRLAASGHGVLSGQILAALALDLRTGVLDVQPSDPGLTARELDVLRLIADGADNATIGRELAISRHTVKQYVANIFEKLGVHSRVEAAVHAVRRGLV